MLPYLETNNGHQVLRWSHMPQWIGKDTIKEGSLYAGVITQFDGVRATIALSPFVSGHINLIDISSSIDILNNFKLNCYVGLRLVVTVASVKTSPHRMVTLNRLTIESAATGQFSIDLSKNNTIDSIPNMQSSSTDTKPGSIVTGIINLTGSNKIPRPPAIQVQLANNKFGRICATEIADPGNWKADLTPLFTDSTSITELEGGLKHGEICEFRVLSLPDNGPIELSCRPSRLVLRYSFIISLTLFREKRKRNYPLSLIQYLQLVLVCKHMLPIHLLKDASYAYHPTLLGEF